LFAFWDHHDLGNCLHPQSFAKQGNFPPHAVQLSLAAWSKFAVGPWAPWPLAAASPGPVVDSQSLRSRPVDRREGRELRTVELGRRGNEGARVPERCTTCRRAVPMAEVDGLHRRARATSGSQPLRVAGMELRRRVESCHIEISARRHGGAFRPRASARHARSLKGSTVHTDKRRATGERQVTGHLPKRYGESISRRFISYMYSCTTSTSIRDLQYILWRFARISYGTST
jgi:hypothetical protein